MTGAGRARPQSSVKKFKRYKHWKVGEALLLDGSTAMVDPSSQLLIAGGSKRGVG
jgi:hypothetical protein